MYIAGTKELKAVIKAKTAITTMYNRIILDADGKRYGISKLRANRLLNMTTIIFARTHPVADATIAIRTAPSLRIEITFFLETPKTLSNAISRFLSLAIMIFTITNIIHQNKDLNSGYSNR